MKKTLLVMGGDRRMEYAAAALSSDFDVYTYGYAASRPIWELKQADILVLPYLSLKGEYLNAPLITQKIPAVSSLDMLRYGGVLFGGGLPGRFLSYCSERGAKVFDFFDDENLTMKNAFLTAEGAVSVILNETDFSIGGSDIHIFGFGRVAKACAKAMSALGANVTVAARSEIARQEAAEHGYGVSAIGNTELLSKADAIINTVPRRIIGRDEICVMKKEAVILDLASAPYGTDFDAAKELGIKALTAPGLPGKIAPKTAGEFIAESIIGKLREVDGLEQH